jgi:hypothetical protein
VKVGSIGGSIQRGIDSTRIAHQSRPINRR